MYISGIWGQNPLGGLSPNFLEEDIPDVITCFKFGDDRLRGLASAEGQILPLSIDFDGRTYNTLTLPCERVILHCEVTLQTSHQISAKSVNICNSYSKSSKVTQQHKCPL